MGLAVRFGRRPEGLTLAEYFRRCGQGEAARRLLWDPLALAILNEPAERAAAVLFHRVYEEAFLRDHRASRLVFLRRGWARPARARWPATSRAAAVSCGAGRGPRASSLEDGRVRRRALRAAGGDARGDRGRRAPPRRGSSRPTRSSARSRPRAARRSCPRSGARGRPSRRSRASPARRSSPSRCGSTAWSWTGRCSACATCEVEWVFDKGRLYGREGAPQHLAFIVSAAYRSAAKPNAELVAAAEGALRRYFPAMAEARVERSLVLRDPLATFASSPEIEPLRPGPRHADRGPLPGRRLDRHRPPRHDRGRGAQRAARRHARARVPDDARGRLSAACFPRLRWAAAAFLAVYVPAYALAYGLANFLFLCNLSVLLAGAGLWACSRCSSPARRWRSSSSARRGRSTSRPGS